MAKKVTVRKATVKDIPAAVELWKELMDLHKALDPVFTRRRGGHKAFAEYLRKEYIGGDRRRAWVARCRILRRARRPGENRARRA